MAILVVAAVFLVPLAGSLWNAWRLQRRLDEARREVSRVWERGLARFTESADLLPDILVELDAAQVLTFTNSAFQRLGGYSDQDLHIGMTLADALVPEQRPRLLRALAEARSGELPRAHSFHLRRQDGEILPVALYLRPVVQAGRFVGWRGLLRDLQETRRDIDRPRAPHRAAEAVVRAIVRDFARTPAERHDEVVGRALASAGAYLGVDRAYLYRAAPAGDRFAACHLWYAEGVTPLAGDQQAPPLSAYPWVSACFGRGQNLRVPDVTRLPAVSAREREAWQSQGISALMAVPLRDGDNVTGFLGCEVFGEPRQWDERDLDVLETIAEICQQMRARLPRLGDLLPDPAFVVDPAGTVVAWNEALALLTGEPAARRLGGTAAEAATVILGADARPWPVQALLAAPAAATGALETSVRIDHAAQESTQESTHEAYWRLVARPLHDEAGRFLGAVQIVQDITAATHAERYLRRRVREAERGQSIAREEMHRLRDAIETNRFRGAHLDGATEQAN